MYLIVAIPIIVFLFAYVNSENCPPEILTRPCECFPEYGLTLECRNLTDATDLYAISRRTGNITFMKLRMFNSSIESIPENTVMKKQFSSIEIYNSELRFLFSTVDEYSSIRSLDLLNVEFGQSFPWKQLKPLENLVTFVAERVFIFELSEELKNNVNKNLVSLVLWDTRTKWISDETFSEHKELREVTIENCRLRELKRNYFARPAEKLYSLNFNGNGIQVLGDDIFEAMPKLQFVSLKRNKMSTIQGAIFKSMDHQLDSFLLEENPLRCDCEFKWIVSSYKPRYELSGKCDAGPEELKGKELLSLKSEDFELCQ